eukprot:COSAG01_NODE_47033_length_394_cov_1.057627_1_plen_65_part_01
METPWPDTWRRRGLGGGGAEEGSVHVKPQAALTTGPTKSLSPRRMDHGARARQEKRRHEARARED